MGISCQDQHSSHTTSTPKVYYVRCREVTETSTHRWYQSDHARCFGYVRGPTQPSTSFWFSAQICWLVKSGLKPVNDTPWENAMRENCCTWMNSDWTPPPGPACFSGLLKCSWRLFQLYSGHYLEFLAVFVCFVYYTVSSSQSWPKTGYAM